MAAPIELIRKLAVKNGRKIILLVADGVGGYNRPGNKSALSSAKKPELKRLAKDSSLGLHLPIAHGVTPGSGPAHLGLFGYDPLKFDIGRGALSAAGVDFALAQGDVAARMNFATLDSECKVSDRRAGRIATEKCVELCERLGKIKLSGVELFVRPEKEHRAMVAFRGEGLGDRVSDTDPQKTGSLPLEAAGEDERSKKTAAAANEFFAAAVKELAGEEKANGLLLRGFASPPAIPDFSEIYKLKAAAVAVYPMYRGLARLVGMEVLECGESWDDQLDTIAANLEKYDFFFVHYKSTDSRGEDGDLKAKAKAVEALDAGLKRLREMPFDVLVLTGDHATPAALAAHSWHPVPILVWAETMGADGIADFDEASCRKGGLGIISSLDIMPLAMGCALKLNKYGA